MRALCASGQGGDRGGDVVVGDEAETQAHTRLGTTQCVRGCGDEIPHPASHSEHFKSEL